MIERNSSQYLDHYLEPKEEAPKDLEIPFFKDGDEWSYSGKDEAYSHNDGELGLSFDCQNLEEDFVEELRQLVLAKGHKDQKEIEKYTRFFTPPIFVLRDMQITKVDSQNQILDIKQFLAKPGDIEDGGVIIFINPSESDIDTEVINEVMGTKVVFLSGNPTRLTTLLALMHEIGHAQTRDEVSDSMIGYLHGRPISKDEARTVLNEERDAWTFALEALRPYIRREEYENVNKFIHDRALASHSNHLRGQTSPDWVAKVAKWIDEKVRKWQKEKIAERRDTKL